MLLEVSLSDGPEKEKRNLKYTGKNGQEVWDTVKEAGKERRSGRRTRAVRKDLSLGNQAAPVRKER